MTENDRPIISRRPATWMAANGHLMSGDEISIDGGPWRTEGWSAFHSDRCQCTGFVSEEYAGEVEFDPDDYPDPYHYIDENFPV